MNYVTENIIPFFSKYKLEMTIAIIIIVILFFVMKKKVEKLEISMLDNVIVNPQCEGMTPMKLFALFNNDLDAMTKAVIDNGLSVDDLANTDNYPKIATYLSDKKVISC